MRLVPLSLALAVLAAPAAAQQLSFTLHGSVSALNPPPTSGPFAGSQVGDAVEFAVQLVLPGSPSTTSGGTVYDAVAPASILTVGTAQDALDPAGAPRVGVFDSYLGLRDRLALFNEPLVQGGLVRFELIDVTDTVIDTSDLTLLRGTYPASSFTTISFGAQVGGGFLELGFDELVVGLPGPGEVVCAPAVPNSTGAPALVFATGSDVLASNSLTLEARRLPANTFGFFLVSDVQANVAGPGGSQGVLCLGGSIGRYQSSAQNSGAGGAIGLAIDLTALPSPTGAVAAQVGETWTFQAWYRDANPSPTSNFTDALAVTLR